jgi:hypothetical protein
MTDESLAEAFEFCADHPAEIVPCLRCERFAMVRDMVADRFAERAGRGAARRTAGPGSGGDR